MFDILKQIMRVGIIRDAQATPRPPDGAGTDPELRALSRAPCIRHVDTGSCNGCELEIHALGNAYYNIEAGGMKFVASPRHADLLLLTGPLSPHMREALERTDASTPAPRKVVAVGDCAINGGIFGSGYASSGGVDAMKVDAEVPGCPPSPAAIIDGIRRALDQP